MIFDPDHMSVYARNQALDLVEAEQLFGNRLVAQLEHPKRAAADLRARRGGDAVRRLIGELRRASSYQKAFPERCETERCTGS